MKSEDIHGGKVWQICRDYGLKQSDILDFSASINPLGMPASIPPLLSNFNDALHYPDDPPTALIQAFAESKGIPPECVLAGNGSTEFIYLIPRALKPRNAFTVIPTYSDYERALRLANSDIQYYILREENNFCLDVDALIKSAENADLIFLGNPNNPTGVSIESEKLIYLEKKLPKTLIVIDEAFIDFLTPNQSVIKQSCNPGNIIVIYSVTKFYAIPGIRLGYVISNPSTISKLAPCKEPWTVNVIAQKTGLELLNCTSYKEETISLVEKERAFLVSELSKLKSFKPYPSAANFILIKILSPEIASKKLYEKLLLKNKILVRDCGNFNGLEGEFIRIAVRTREENERLIEALKKIL